MANPAFVQAKGGSGSASPLNIAFTSAVGAGSLLIAVFRINGTASAITVTDTQGNLYTNLGNISTVNEVYEMWYAPNAVGGACTVHINFTFGTGSAISGEIGEYSGVATVAPIDGSTSAAGTNSGNTTTTTSGDLLIGWGGNNTGTAFTQGAGYTQRFSQSNVTAFEDKLAGAPGSYNATFAAGPVDTGIAAFKPTPSSGGGSSSSWLTVALANSLRGLRH